MDLVTTVRKEGSRGGRDAFTWESVKSDAHRENYLGHSLMAPVGRWQAKRDLNWYAKGDADPSSAQKEEDARREEIRRIKEAEEDALSAALGLPVAPRREQAPSAIEKGEVDRVLKDVVGSGMGEDDGGVETGLGYGQYGGRGTGADNVLASSKREKSGRGGEVGVETKKGRKNEGINGGMRKKKAGTGDVNLDPGLEMNTEGEDQHPGVMVTEGGQGQEKSGGEEIIHIMSGGESEAVPLSIERGPIQETDIVTTESYDS